MPEAEKTERRTAGTAWLGIAIAVGVILLLLLVGWLEMESARSERAWLAFLRGSPPFADAWIGDIRAGRLDAAYRATSAAYRARVDREAFGRWIADHPEFQRTPDLQSGTMSKHVRGFTIGLNGVRIWDPPPKLTYRATFRPAGEAPRVLSIVVTTDPAGLHIDRPEIEPEAPAKP